MKTLHPGLAAHLAGGVTTLARCWTLTRRDNVRLGFTDHDRDIAFDGVTHQARSGLQASDASAELGLAVASSDVAGVLHAAGLSEADIQRGLYDGAEVRIHLVDWHNPDSRELLDVMVIGEITRGDNAFVAELRSAAHRFDEERGRLYTLRCGADLGDGRCRKTVTASVASVVATDGRRQVSLSGLAGFAGGWFNAGRLVFASGANAGHAVEVRLHVQAATVAVLDLWLETPLAIAVGDTVSVTPGCDKSFGTCQAKFANSINFQGFPHMPGNDALLQIAGNDRRQVFDGGSLFR